MLRGSASRKTNKSAGLKQTDFVRSPQAPAGSLRSNGRVARLVGHPQLAHFDRELELRRAAIRLGLAVHGQRDAVAGSERRELMRARRALARARAA